ncbi:MAG: UDP-N-acetylmuramoyl-L-alanine--D-glutamate ligase [Bacteroidales bacterium]|nr:UDP-N-acetylmuramoyl-L-alanine--D-glutamate ligase [Bacteroidales bacterium]
MAQKIVILGAGESGIGAAILAQKKGFDVFVSDCGKIKENYIEDLKKYSISFEQGQHSEEKILSADEIIKSPGIRNDAPLIKKLVAQGTPVISEIEFAARYTNAVKVCITGSNGKTTTTELIYKTFKDAGLNVGIAGNVGKSFALQVAENNYDYYVIELSSFQLDNMYKFKAEIAILLNVTPDHLDRYDYKMQNYTDSKFRITQNQTKEDLFIYCADDPITAQEIKKRTFAQRLAPFSLNNEQVIGSYLKNGNMIIKLEKNEAVIDTANFSLEGQHNMYNSMAAGIAAMACNIRSNSIRQSFETFKGLEHRLEHFLSVRGVEFVNDSKATNVNSVWYALESIKTKVILILGGIDKGNDYSELFSLVKQKVKAIVALGVNNKPIHDAFDSMVEVIDTQSMENCVKTCYLLADKGDTVLLSPACASFDLFTCYEDRGEKFKEAVRNL